MLEGNMFLFRLEAYCVISIRRQFVESVILPGSRRRAETYDLMGEAKAWIHMALHGPGCAWM